MSSEKNFEFVRVAKITTAGGLKAAARHDYREKDVPNADASKRQENQELAGPGSVDAIMGKHREILDGLQKQKNSVLALEYVITFSPTSTIAKDPRSQQEYFARGLAWIQEKHGSANVLSYVVHRDEKTPHAHVLVVPVREREGKIPMLSAKHYVDGRGALSQMQDHFHEHVGQPLGLDRGLRGSAAKHMEIRDFYGHLHQAQKTAEIPRIPYSHERISPVEAVTEKGRQAFEERVKNHYVETLVRDIQPKIVEAQQLRLEASQETQRTAALQDEVVRLREKAEKEAAAHEKTRQSYRDLVKGISEATPQEIKELQKDAKEFVKEGERLADQSRPRERGNDGWER